MEARDILKAIAEKTELTALDPYTLTLPALVTKPEIPNEAVDIHSGNVNNVKNAKMKGSES
jgi:hypothetical protein